MKILILLIRTSKKYSTSDIIPLNTRNIILQVFNGEFCGIFLATTDFLRGIPCRLPVPCVIILQWIIQLTHSYLPVAPSCQHWTSGQYHSFVRIKCAQNAQIAHTLQANAHSENRVNSHTTKYLRMQSTEQCLASSKMLTPHPLSPQRVCPPPAPKARGYTLAGR